MSRQDGLPERRRLDCREYAAEYSHVEAKVTSQDDAEGASRSSPDAIFNSCCARLFRFLSKKFHDALVFKGADLEDFRSNASLEQNQIFIDALKDQETKKAILELTKDRSRIYEEQAERAEMSAETYLWLANAGFAAGITTVAVKQDHLLTFLTTKISLCCFIISVALIGWIKAFRIIRMYRIKERYRKMLVKFLSSEISLQFLLNADRNTWREPRILIYPAWTCYILFFFGVLSLIIGILY